MMIEDKERERDHHDNGDWGICIEDDDERLDGMRMIKIWMVP